MDVPSDTTAENYLSNILVALSSQWLHSNYVGESPKL